MGDHQHLEDDVSYADSGDETDIEDNLGNDEVVYPSLVVRRDATPELPGTVEVLTTRNGCKVYLVGTAHFSESSQEDVAKTIRQTKPDFVVVELCPSRVNILSLDEETLLREAKNIDIQKIRQAIRQSGVLQGILHVLLLSLSARITEQLGMAPGGEFRTAFREAQQIPGCRVRLGDRPIGITLRRALSALSWYQKLTLTISVFTCRETISKEDVERCKQRDLLEEMLVEMTGEFPELSRVFVTERDMFLAHMLRTTAVPIKDPHSTQGSVPSVTVAVVGMGHVPGIVANWENEDIDVHELLAIPKTSTGGMVVKWVFRATLASAVVWGSYKAFKLTVSLVRSFR